MKKAETAEARRSSEEVRVRGVVCNEKVQQIELPHCLNCLATNSACTVCLKKSESKYGNVSRFRCHSYILHFAIYYGIFTEFIDLEVSSMNLFFHIHFLFAHLLSLTHFVLSPCLLNLCRFRNRFFFLLHRM